MNIFFITSWFPSRVHHNNGGFIGRHARLVAREHGVTVVALEVDPALKTGQIALTERKEEGYIVVHAYVGHKNVTPGPIKTLIRFRAYQKALRRARKLSGKPDLLHGHVLLDGGIAAALWSRFWNLPFVLTEHSSAYLKPRALSGFRFLLGNYACRHAHTIMPVSDQLRLKMEKLNGLKGRYRVVSNVVNGKLYKYLPPPATKVFRLLHISSLKESDKNISGILRAFEGLVSSSSDNFRLHVAGSGNLGELEEKILALGVKNITYSGPHTEVEIAQIIQEHHALVLFSNFETQGVVLLEAQMSGRPCIGTDLGAIAESVEPGFNGVLVPIGNEEALTAAMRSIADNYERFDLLAIRERASGRYGEETVIRALNEVYSAALE